MQPQGLPTPHSARCNANQPQHNQHLPPRPDKDGRQAALTLQARFCASRDLLVVLLRREILIFDLELGHPAASSPLPAGRPAFAGLLGVFGEGVTQVRGGPGGGVRKPRPAPCALACDAAVLPVWLARRGREGPL